MVDGKTGARTVVEPTPEKIMNWKQSNVDVVKRAMAGVIREGTGAKAFAGATYTAAGKTGTAQVYSLKGAKYSESGTKAHLRDHAWFIAYAPAEDPKIALAVLVENGGWGAAAAAPIARQVLDYYLTGKEPAQPASEVESSDSD